MSGVQHGANLHSSCDLGWQFHCGGITSLHNYAQKQHRIAVAWLSKRAMVIVPLCYMMLKVLPQLAHWDTQACRSQVSERRLALWRL